MYLGNHVRNAFLVGLFRASRGPFRGCPGFVWYAYLSDGQRVDEEQYERKQQQVAQRYKVFCPRIQPLIVHTKVITTIMHTTPDGYEDWCMRASVACVLAPGAFIENGLPTDLFLFNETSSLCSPYHIHAQIRVA